MEDAPVRLFEGTRHDIASEVDKVIPPVACWQERVLCKVLIQGGDVVLKRVILPNSSD